MYFGLKQSVFAVWKEHKGNNFSVIRKQTRFQVGDYVAVIQLFSQKINC